MNQTNWTTLLIALLGVAKLTLQPWGIEITDQHINDITNGFATALTIGGVIYHHIKQPKQPSHPFDTSSQAKGVTYNAQSQIADQPRI